MKIDHIIMYVSNLEAAKDFLLNTLIFFALTMAQD